MWKWIVVLLAVAGAVAGVVLAVRGREPPPASPHVRVPVRNPYAHAIAGAGLVEPSSENVVVGAPEAGIVTKLWAVKGATVAKGDPLFVIDTRTLEAERLAAEARVATADAELARVRAYRRPEDEAILRAKAEESGAAAEVARLVVAEADASVADAEWACRDADAKLARSAALVATRAVSEQDHDDARFAAERAKARLAAAVARAGAAKSAAVAAEARAAGAQADLELFRAGPWPPDVARAEAAAAEARAGVARIALEVDRRTVRAPIDGTVLRCRLHEGEFAPAATQDADQAALVLGQRSRLHVRVDVDEFDAIRFRAGAAATAFLKGRSEPAMPLTFVAVEPFVAPKRALTNSQRELVDTRVLQAIYAFDGERSDVYPGQQVDVFIETPASAEHER